jgi:predicted DNA binding CopG/RHH family protein
MILENKISDKECIFSKIKEIKDFVKTKKINNIIFDYKKLNKSIVNISVNDFF